MVAVVHGSVGAVIGGLGSCAWSRHGVAVVPNGGAALVFSRGPVFVLPRATTTGSTAETGTRDAQFAGLWEKRRAARRTRL